MLRQHTVMKTTDISDQQPNDAQVAEDVGLRHFGGRHQFQGPIFTLRCFEDNALLKQLLGQPGKGQVMVVDGGGSRRCALVGDQLAALAIDNGWSGLVVNGCIRDSAAVANLPLGLMALGTVPRRGGKVGQGDIGKPLSFANVSFETGHCLYADEDGIVLSALRLT